MGLPDTALKMRSPHNHMAAAAVFVGWDGRLATQSGNSRARYSCIPAFDFIANFSLIGRRDFLQAGFSSRSTTNEKKHLHAHFHYHLGQLLSLQDNGWVIGEGAAYLTRGNLFAPTPGHPSADTRPF